ncbi:hypothetical protein [Dactylosporangium sp. NPDC049140]|uniref:hypothetical protein n=1 Tax=Dactylosporangium sp. NPDC049140 TaxID=3155647 RepID=UPI0033C96D65
MDIEVIGAQPVPERPAPGRSRRGTLTIALAVAVGTAFGYALAIARPAPRMIISTPAAPATTAAPAGLTPAEQRTMVRRVEEYNKPDGDAVEITPVRLMTGLRNNLTRLDDERSYPAGEYRLQVICLGDGQVWALFRIGDDETYVDVDCQAGRLVVTQLVLTARAGGRRTVTAVTDSTLGVVVGLQVLRRG